MVRVGNFDQGWRPKVSVCKRSEPLLSLKGLQINPALGKTFPPSAVGPKAAQIENSQGMTLDRNLDHRSIAKLSAICNNDTISSSTLKSTVRS
jgi:hypothetical protein